MSGTTGYRVDPGTGFGAGIALVKTGGLLSGYLLVDPLCSGHVAQSGTDEHTIVAKQTATYHHYCDEEKRYDCLLRFPLPLLS
jgi:hypothetical protein